MEQPAIQDQLGGHRCYGCGPLNEQGLQIKSYWDGEETVCHFEPRPWHVGGPNFLNGGVIATIIDCHCVNTAMAATYKAEGRAIGSDPKIWCVTGSMQISYIKPTSMDEPVQLRARVIERSGRKTRVACSLFAKGEETVKAEVLAIQVPWREMA